MTSKYYEYLSKIINSEYAAKVKVVKIRTLIRENSKDQSEQIYSDISAICRELGNDENDIADILKFIKRSPYCDIVCM
jgi:hypothetical protein